MDWCVRRVTRVGSALLAIAPGPTDDLKTLCTSRTLARGPLCRWSDGAEATLVGRLFLDSRSLLDLLD